MARLCTLASSSSGNSTYISTSDGDILVDAGISCKSLLTAIESVGGDISRIKAVAVTHSHSDHITGLRAFLKKTKIPVIAATQTLEYLCEHEILTPEIKAFCAEQGDVVFGDISVKYFSTSHDSEGSGGYVITLPDARRVAVCTDLGVMTDCVRQNLYGCGAVLIESNYDVEMLKRGPYPANLKLRIMSEVGHLSNNACAVELPKLLQNGTNRIILGHLSKQNNTPALAMSAATATLADIGAKQGDDYILKTAKPSIAEVTAF